MQSKKSFTNVAAAVSEPTAASVVMPAVIIKATEPPDVKKFEFVRMAMPINTAAAVIARDAAVKRPARREKSHIILKI